MAKNYSDLREGLSAAALQRSQSKTRAMLAKMPLQELRKARGLSQKALAARLNIQQPAVARLEKRTDMYISTLRDHIQAMGGELDIIARFPEGEVKVQAFGEE